MSKKNSIVYIKPEEPNFLKELKEQIGYKEGATIHTKREDLPSYDDSDLPDHDDEPQVVVLKPGDLTADEVAAEKVRQEKEIDETPADLSARVLFKGRAKVHAPAEEDKVFSGPHKRHSTNATDKVLSGPHKRPPASATDKVKTKKSKHKVVLSFDEEENDDL